MEIAPLQMTPVQMHAQSHLTEEVQDVEDSSSQTFGEYLADALKTTLKDTNQLELEADAWSAALAAGRVDDVSQVVIAAQKADIALQLTLQLRNRAVSAYQEIIRMQV